MSKPMPCPSRESSAVSVRAGVHSSSPLSLSRGFIFLALVVRMVIYSRNAYDSMVASIWELCGKKHFKGIFQLLPLSPTFHALIWHLLSVLCALEGTVGNSNGMVKRSLISTVRESSHCKLNRMMSVSEGDENRQYGDSVDSPKAETFQCPEKGTQYKLNQFFFWTYLWSPEADEDDVWMNDSLF